MALTLKSITDLYKDTFPTEDDGIIALMAAILIGSKQKTPPVWLYLIGPTSGGKSTFIEAFNGVPFTTQVSDLTINTFLSGMASNRKETSLLRRLGTTFTIMMKDFTTILQKPAEVQGAIIAQMREIYDGHITKETGTGITLEWGSKHTDKKGHATFIMASTEAIFSAQEKFADMGTRAINYILLPQHRMICTLKSMRNNNNMEVERMKKIQDTFREFVIEKINAVPKELPYITEEMEKDIAELADFSSICRSVIKRDYRGVKTLALSAEMPMRIAKQLLSITQFMTYANDGILEQYLKDAVFKTALDSIPKQRRLILEALTRYKRANRSGIGDYINYPPERIQEWLEDLNMFGICIRTRSGEKQYWQLKDEYRNIMIKFSKIIPEDKELIGEGGENYNENAGNYADVDMSYERNEEMEIVKENAEIVWNEFTNEN